jgi:uncharacterized membrane protein HdeD (DUF308 family)
LLSLFRFDSFGCRTLQKENLINAETTVGAVRKVSGWSMLWGILMFICGILAIGLPLASSIGIVILLAWLILFAGISHLIFAFHSHSIGGFLWQILLVLIYGAAAIYMLMNPLLGVLSLTLVLAVFLLVEGILEMALYFRIRQVRHAGWVLFDGIVTLILGIVIWAQWPSSSIWVIGTLVGISLIFSGISRFMLSLAVRHLSAASA